MRSAAAALVLLLAAPAAMGVSDIRKEAGILRVAVVQSARKVRIRTDGDFIVRDLATGRRSLLQDGQTYLAEVRNAEHIIVGSLEFGDRVRLVPTGANSALRIDDKLYRGVFSLRTNGEAKLTVIEELGIEEYLYGVLPREMNASWPLEALKAQAVVSRTFALRSLGKHDDRGFDLTADEFSQVYQNEDAVDPQVRRAVDSTAGQILTYKGRPMTTFFHSTCGGHTQPVDLVWGGGSEPIKPLSGVRDSFCRISPHWRWQAYFPNRDILRVLQARGYKATKIKRIRVADKAGAGTVLWLEVDTDAADFRVRGADLRTWLGARDLKSVQFTRVVKTQGGWEFHGRGYGHGVGLCQWGARAQAQKGRAYDKILDFYYPGSSIASAAH